MNIALVIFDCDGVLVDSEPISNRILAQMMTEVGIPMTTEKTMEMFMGRATTVWLNYMESTLGYMPENFLKNFRGHCAEIFSKELKPVDGIVDVLETLSYPYCVASSGPHEKMDVTLGVTGLKEKFRGNIFSAQDVGRGKPAPDIFLYAAEKMGVDPRHCVVVEDSIHGVQAAIAAQMKVFAYCPEADKQSPFVSEGARIITEMSHLPQFLSDL